MRVLLLIIALCAVMPVWASEPDAVDPLLRAAISGPQRSAEFIRRDAIRHPLEELLFFDIAPNAHMVEIWPGAGYWTEMLAPYLHDHGLYYVAVPPATEAGNERSQIATFKRKLAADPATYGKIVLTELGEGHYEIAPGSSLDLVLTFRNYHDWIKAGWAEAALASFYRALKPGGILGFEEHRGRDDVAQDPEAINGYVRQDYVIAAAKKAGFDLAGSSEINANPRDTKDYPEGVWTLPPTFALGAVDHEKYAAIGEGDNMVLKLKKPAR